MSLAVLDAGPRSWRAMPDTVGLHLTYSEYTTPPHVLLISWLLMLNAIRPGGAKHGHTYLPRLGLSMPPGSGKSELVDHWNSVWLLDNDPRRRIVLASYAGLLAEEQGKRVRNTIEDAADVLRVRIMQDTRAAASWKTSQGGGMWTMGVGGTLTGRRASNLFVDDPHKSFAEAMSEKNQVDTWNWFTSTARTRLLPRSPMGVVQTRWNESDTIGKLKAQDQKVAWDSPGKWLFVALPAIADQDETIETVLGPEWSQRLTAQGVELFPWVREQGQPLWPELTPGVPWFDEEEYGQIRDEVGELIWAGLYQQRPAPLEGVMFKRDRWQRIDAVPPGEVTRVRRWDLAGTADPSADATASCLMTYHHPTKTLYIEDMTRDRVESHEVETLVRMTAINDRDLYGQVYVRVEREPGQSGKAQESSYLRNVLPEFTVEFIPSTGAKEVRAMPFAGQQGARHVHLCRRFDGDQYSMPEWWAWLIEEAAAFPHGSFDDLVDVCSLAYVDLLDLVPRRSKARAQSSARKTLGF
jgi:predicted phage terminase large subunit-like protein